MTTSARDVAVKALRLGAGASSALADLTTAAALSRTDAAFARELTLGCIRRRETLRAVTRAMLTQPGRRRPGAVDAILHVAMYQLLYLDRVPDFAAVNEAVQQAGRCGCPKQAGLINAILRNLLRDLLPLEQGGPPAAADVIPIGPESFRRCKRAIFPDPDQDPADYLKAAANLPGPLADRWLMNMDSLETVCRIAACSNASPPLIARVNALRSDVPAVLASLEADGAEALPHDNGCSVVIQHGPPLTELAAFRDGWFQPQDPTATAVVNACPPQPGMDVLDLCAAPGTKTTHMAEKMRGDGTITAVDVLGKLQRIEDNCRRMGIDIVQTVSADRTGSLPVEGFDMVLADVPCTNTGVLSRRPEARWRFRGETLWAAVADQKFLLNAAAAFVRQSGTLVYSTCSIEPEENDELIGRFLGKFPAFKLVRKQQTLPDGAADPTRWHDGGFTAILQKR